MPKNPSAAYTLSQKLIAVVLLAILLGWMINRAILTARLDEVIARRSLRDRPAYRVDNTFTADTSTLFQQKSEFHVVYKILKCWRQWAKNENEWCVEFTTTALGMLDCESFKNFQERHLVISKHAKLKFNDDELASLERFVEAALNHAK